MSHSAVGFVFLMAHAGPGDQHLRTNFSIKFHNLWVNEWRANFNVLTFQRQLNLAFAKSSFCKNQKKKSIFLSPKTEHRPYMERRKEDCVDRIQIGWPHENCDFDEIFIEIARFVFVLEIIMDYRWIFVGISNSILRNWTFYFLDVQLIRRICFVQTHSLHSDTFAGKPLV